MGRYLYIRFQPQNFSRGRGQSKTFFGGGGGGEGGMKNWEWAERGVKLEGRGASIVDILSILS